MDDSENQFDDQLEDDIDLGTIEDLVICFLDESMLSRFRDWVEFHDFDIETILFIEQNSTAINKLLADNA